MQGFWKDSIKHFSKSKRKHILKQYWHSEYSKTYNHHSFSFNSPVFSVNYNTLAVYPSSPGCLTNYFTSEVYSLKDAKIDNNIAYFKNVFIPVQLFYFFQSYFCIYPSFKQPIFANFYKVNSYFEEHYPFASIIAFKNTIVEYEESISTVFSFKWSQERSNYIKYQNKDMGYIDYFYGNNKKPYRIMANRKSRRKIKEFNQKCLSNPEYFDEKFPRSHSLEKSILWAII